MLSIERTVLVLLAAGRALRFGADKLAQEFRGRPLGLHVAIALEGMPFLDRVAVTGGSGLDYAPLGFRCVRNEDPALGMGRSVSLGVAEAQGADAVLVVLADMPLVTAEHVRRLFEASEGKMSVVASSDGTDPRPPAIFGRGRFAALRGLSGEAGARELIRAGRHVVAAPGELVDVDTPEGLAALAGS